MKIRLFSIALVFGLATIIISGIVLLWPNDEDAYNSETHIGTSHLRIASIVTPGKKDNSLNNVLKSDQSLDASVALKPRIRMEKDSSASNVLKDALAINGEKAPKPATNFRAGHVTPASISDFLKVTDNGFQLDLKNSTQVPTPTIYKGKLYVSGGFGSKVFHCFDAQNGSHIWSINLDDDGPSSAVIEDGVIVFNTESCTIFACEAASGKMLWSWWLGDPLMSMPTIKNGKVFTAYPAGHYTLNNSGNSKVGNLNQMQQNPNAIQPKKVPDPKDAPVIKSRLRPTHALVAFDLKTGKIDWQKWIDGDIMSAPVASEDELYVVTFPGTFYKFKQGNGDILAASAARATSAPVIVNNDIYFSKRTDGDGETATESNAWMSTDEMNEVEVNKASQKRAYYLDKATQDGSQMKTSAAHQDAGNGFGSGAPLTSGAVLASRNIGQSNVSSLQAYQGARVLNYKGNNYSVRGDELVCIPAKGGEPLWGIKLKGDLKTSGGFLGTPPLAVSGKLIVANLQGDIVIYDAVSGKEEERYETGIPIRQQPVVEDGWIYAGTTQGKVLAINTGNSKLTGWPVWGGDAAHSGVPMEQ